MVPFAIYFLPILTPIFLSLCTTLPSFPHLLSSPPTCPPPSPPPTPFFSTLWWKREFWKRERERETEEVVEGEGWVPIRAAASSFHVARKTTLRQREGNIRWRTSTCTRGTPTQVRRPWGGSKEMNEEKRGKEKKCFDLWPLIQNLLHFAFLLYLFYLLTFCDIWLTGRKKTIYMLCKNCTLLHRVTCSRKW